LAHLKQTFGPQSQLAFASNPPNVGLMGAADDWIKQKSVSSVQPPQVETALRQISENWPEKAPPLESIVEEFPLGAAPLLHLLAISSICAFIPIPCCGFLTPT
jgi:hypothetical protein